MHDTTRNADKAAEQKVTDYHGDEPAVGPHVDAEVVDPGECEDCAPVVAITTRVGHTWTRAFLDSAELASLLESTPDATQPVEASFGEAREMLTERPVDRSDVELTTALVERPEGEVLLLTTRVGHVSTTLPLTADRGREFCRRLATHKQVIDSMVDGALDGEEVA